MSTFQVCFLNTGVGGQIDFLRGAALGDDGQGKPILALNSVTKRGESKISPFLKQGKRILAAYDCNRVVLLLTENVFTRANVARITRFCLGKDAMRCQNNFL